MTSNKGSGTQFGETLYISEINGDRKVNLTQELRPRAEIFPWGWLGITLPQLNSSKLLELSETSRARKLIFGLHVNIKINSRRYDVTQ